MTADSPSPPSLLVRLTRPLAGAAAWSAAAAAFALAAVALLGGLDAPPSAVPDPGVFTRWGLPASRAVHDAAAAVTIGLLVLAAAVLPAGAGARTELLGARLWAVRAAAITGATWFLAGAGALVLTYADAAGTSPFAAGSGAQLRSFIRDFTPGRSAALSLALVAVVTVGALFAARLTGAGLLAVGALAAAVPLAWGGHDAEDGSHATAVTAQVTHVLAVSVWTGGLVGLLAVRRRLGPDVGVVLRRYSTLAGWCFALVGASGVLTALTRLPGWAGLRSEYGSVLVAKVIVLTALGVFGWQQRRHLVAAAHSDPARGAAFARLAAVELALLAMAIGLAIALTRTSPPGPSELDPITLAEALLGFPMPAPLTFVRMFTTWRLDLLWAGLAVLAVVSYVVGARRLRRRGDPWPITRTVAWTAGWVILVWATSAGPGVYSRVLFSMHMVQHMTITMVVPVLLVLAAPVTLALRALPARRDGSNGAREWLLTLVHARALAVLAHPLVAAGIFAGSLAVFYASPLFEWALRTHTGHVVMTVHFLLSGYLFAWVICGPDPGPRRPPYVFRIILLLVTFAFHASLGIALMSSTQITGGDWFAQLPRDWGPSLTEDQNRGGAIAWGLGDLSVLVLALALMRAWVSDDARKARHSDRQANRDGDAGCPPTTPTSNSWRVPGPPAAQPRARRGGNHE